MCEEERSIGAVGRMGYLPESWELSTRHTNHTALFSAESLPVAPPSVPWIQSMLLGPGLGGITRLQRTTAEASPSLQQSPQGPPRAAPHSPSPAHTAHPASPLDS